MLLLALLAQEPYRAYIELGRIEAPSDWIAPLAALSAMAVLVVLVYLADCQELGRRQAAVLITLRILAVGGLFVIYLKPQKRSEQRVVQNSRAVILVDTSQSMGLRDFDLGSETRLEQVRRELEEGRLVSQLRRLHEVRIALFDGQVRRMATMPPLGARHDDSNRVEAAPAAEPGAASSTSGETPDWNALTPSGDETRLGEALREVLDEERGKPLSAIIVLTDGGQNAGLGPELASQAALENGVPVFPVGLGSNRLPARVVVSDVTAPRRVFPRDGFKITAYVQATHLEGRPATVRLFQAEGPEGSSEGKGELLTVPLNFPADGEVRLVEIPVAGLERPGRYAFRVEVAAPPEDDEPADNARTLEIDVTDSKTRVLLMASGPCRDYIFLRNQLFRDQVMVVDVWLQSAREGISQDARRILHDFPATREELFAYDCLIAFDLDWRKLNESQWELLEDWVAQQAGGLVIVAGNVEMDRSVRDVGTGPLGDLSPVFFQQTFSRFESQRRGASEPMPITVTPEGRDAELMWLGNTAALGLDAWRQFPGVFTPYVARGPKPGATVYAHVAHSPLANDSAPIFLAGHFFGAGRVYFLASAEVWRMRRLDETYFEQFYTKLIRHVSQGRLLRGSTRARLFVEKDRYSVGDAVQVRAQLFDSKFEPLVRPDVSMELAAPEGPRTLTLAAEPGRSGMYAGSFTVTRPGSYGLSLAAPEASAERASRVIEVFVPQRETEDPRRRDDVLLDIARKTGGTYYVGLSAIHGEGGVAPLAAQLKDKTRITYVRGAPDRVWEQIWMQWSLVAVCGVLFLEWTLRRVWRLA